MRKFLSFLLAVMMALPLTAALAESDHSKAYTIVSYQMSSQGRQPDENDEILKVLEEKFNIDLKINVITSEYESKLNLEVASDNMPDIIKVNQALFNAYLEQDLLLPIEDYVESMPNFMSVYPDVLTDATLRVNGHLYFLKGNKQAKDIVKSYDSLWIRKDWLDKLGLSVPTTLEELKEVAIAFTTQDPDGNGVNDTYGFTGLGGSANAGAHYALNPFLGAFGVGASHYILNENGELVYSSATEQYRDALEWIAGFIATGAVDPDMMLLTSYDSVREKVYRNQVGMMYFSWAEFVKPPYDATLSEMTPDAQWIQIAPVQGPGGAYDSCYNVPGYATSGWVLSADLADEPDKLARILEYLDYIVAGEGLDLVCYGVEGVHFNYGPDGAIATTDRINEVSYAWQHQVMGRDEIVYLATKFPTCSEVIRFAKELPRIDSYTNYVGVPEGLNKSDLVRFVTEETTLFIYGKRSFDTWDKYVDTLYQTYGLQQYLDMGTAALKEAGLL